MKRKSKIFIALMSLVSVCSTTSCFSDRNPGTKPEPIEHDHSFSDSAYHCSSVGHWQECTFNGCDETTDIEAHVFTVWQHMKDATFEEEGYNERECTICHYKETETISKKIHHFGGDLIGDKNGHYQLCTDEGYKTLKSEYEEHTFTNWCIDINPSFNKTGTKYRTCIDCNYVENGIVPATGIHTYRSEYEKDETGHWHKCADEGYEDSISEIESHDFIEIEGGTLPTRDVDGEKLLQCKVCEYIKHVTVPATGIPTYSTEFDGYDSTGHWHNCTDEGHENEKTEAEPHVFDKNDWEIVTKPTFDQTGVKQRKCDLCGYVEQGTIEATGIHSFYSEYEKDETSHWHLCSDVGFETLTSEKEKHEYKYTTINDATYENAGLKKAKCTVCGYETTIEIEKLAHSYKSTWDADDTDHWHACLDDGYEGKANGKDVAAHTPEEIIDLQPTFFTQGSKHLHCTVCGKDYAYSAIPAKDHTYAQGDNWTTSATHHWHACLDEGYENNSNVVRDKAEHTASDWIEDTPATFETTGTKHKECSICGYVLETASIPATTHSYSKDWSKDGVYHWHACLDAGYSEFVESKAEHSFEFVVDTPAQFSIPGSGHQQCSVCGYTLAAEEIPALDHTYDTEWSKNATQHWHACLDEGFESLTNGLANHTYGDWIIDDEPSHLTPGHKHQQCSVCGYETTPIEIPAIVNMGDIKLVYNLDNSNSSKSIAKELKDALDYRFDVDTTIIGSETSSTENAINIGFTGDTLEDNQYKVEVNDTSISLIANNTYGTYEAARYLLNNIGKGDLFRSISTTTGTFEENNAEFKIMSYNVRVGNDGTLADGSLGNVVNRAPRIIKNIMDYDPDSVGIQEANDTIVKKLRDGLNSKFKFVGFGRESNRKGETSGIFYNTTKVRLVDAGTKWYSDTPDVPGTHYSNYGGYNRIFTYAILQRLCDGKLYMHVNSHYDLTQDARLLDGYAQKAFTDSWQNKMPVFSTGDFNADKADEGDVIQWFMNNGYTNSIDDIKNPNDASTFPSEGYNKVGVTSNGIIDYIFRCNRGMFIDDYEVINKKVQAENDPAPAPTSDHYPIIAKGHFIEPLMPYTDSYTQDTGNVAINNMFEMINSNSGEMYTSNSTHSNSLSIPAVNENVLKYDQATVGTKTFGDTTINYLGNMDKGSSTVSPYIEYYFDSEEATIGDIVLIASAVNYNSELSINSSLNIGENCELRVNGRTIDLTGLEFAANDLQDYYEFQQLVLKNVNIQKGINVVQLKTIPGKKSIGNQLRLDVFADTGLSIHEFPFEY